MTIEAKLATIDGALDDIKTAIIARGVTPTGDITTYASAVNSIVTESEAGIPREIVNGVYRIPTSNFTFKLPNNATSLGKSVLSSAFQSMPTVTAANLSSLTTVNIDSENAMSYAFYGCTYLTSVDLSNLTTVSGGYSFGFSIFDSAFSGCTRLTSIDLSSLTTVSGGNVMSSMFKDCTSLTSIDLSSLTTITGNYSTSTALSNMFKGCTKLTSVDLSSLTTVSGGYALTSMFNGCTKLTSVDLSSLATINQDKTMSNTFSGCTSLTTLSFPALTSTSFGSSTSQFDNMLSGVTGCTVHFPSNLQSVIGSWASVTNGFGGTNTTVLFDLTATT